jgi:hypothetical protein
VWTYTVALFAFRVFSVISFPVCSVIPLDQHDVLRSRRPGCEERWNDEDVAFMELDRAVLHLDAQRAFQNVKAVLVIVTMPGHVPRTLATSRRSSTSATTRGDQCSTSDAAMVRERRRPTWADSL